MSTINNERADFEKWQLDEVGRCLEELTIGAEIPDQYDCVDVRNEWYAWTASRASLAANAPVAEPFAYCQPDDPNNATAFSWPGYDRGSRHTQPLYTAPPAPTEQWMPIADIPAKGSFQVYMPEEREGERIQTMVRHPNVTSIGNRFDFDMSKPTYYRQLPAPPDTAAKGAKG